MPGAFAEGRGRGGKRFNDLLQHCRQFGQHLVIPETQHSESLSFQPRVSCPVGLASLVLSAIHLDHQAGTETHKIYNVRPEGLLALEFPPRQPVRAQLCPKTALGVGQPTTQGFGYRGTAVWHGSSVAQYFYPSPQPSPARGEGESGLRVCCMGPGSVTQISTEAYISVYGTARRGHDRRSRATRRIWPSGPESVSGFGSGAPPNAPGGAALEACRCAPARRSAFRA